MDLDFIDLFCGGGGFSTGANRAGARVVWAANHLKLAVDYHAANHPDTIHKRQDLMEADWTRVPRTWGMLASPACQGHSQCGQPARKGTGGNSNPNAAHANVKSQRDRNTAWAVVSAADTLRPEMIAIENVPDFQRWELFEAYIGLFHALGYQTAVSVLRASNYGGCQERDRTIITARLGAPAPILEPSYGPAGKTIGSIIDAADFSENKWKPIASKSARMRVRIQKAINKAGSNCFWANVSESRGRTMDDFFPTSTTKSIGQWYIVRNDMIRIMNRGEFARTMSVPEGYLFPKKKEDVGFLVGNMIDVNFAQGIIEQLLMAA